MSHVNRRAWMVRAAAGLGILGTRPTRAEAAGASSAEQRQLKITGLRVTPIALPDPPLLAASGCHGPYFLRNVIEIDTDAGITGIGETHGGEGITRDSTGVEVYTTIFAFEESPLTPGLLWAGSDDGLVHVSRDNGGTWSGRSPVKNGYGRSRES